jgi:DHA1 family bicyclomycin/chloramphenicol resistance-like MFS transporter
MAWLALRQPETLPQARPISVAALRSAAAELAQSRMVITVTLTQSLLLAALFSTLSSQQGIFEVQFNRAANFPIWFGVIALASALGSVVNARVVMRLGMARVVTVSVLGMLILSVLVALANIAGILAFPLHILWSVAMFSLMGLSMGNLNAMAMEKVGHIAGMAASMITAISTVISVILAVPVGLAFDGTALPLYFGVAGFMALATWALR